jgi:uncharacterized membrane protein
MKKLRTVLIVLSAIYIVLTIIFLLNSDSLFNSFNLLKLIDYLQAWIVVSLVLLTGVIIAGSLYIRSLNSHYKKLETEYNKVKARVYDIEQERKTEIEQRRAEEEATEQKLEAFNRSIKDKDRPASDENNPTQSPQS